MKVCDKCGKQPTLPSVDVCRLVTTNTSDPNRDLISLNGFDLCTACENDLKDILSAFFAERSNP